MIKMNDRREETKQNRELSITPNTAALLHVAERLGWEVERSYDSRGMDVLSISRKDILCGPEERDTGLFRHPYSITLPVADQYKLSYMISDNSSHFNINGFANEAFPDSDGTYVFEGMVQDAELLRAAMKSFRDALRQLKNDPEFLQAPTSRALMSILDNKVKELGIYRNDRCYFYDTENLGRCDVTCGFYSLGTMDMELNDIDDLLAEVEYHLDHFKDTFQECLERKLGFEDGFTDILQYAHRAEEEWKKWADACERENYIRVMRADEMTLEDEIVPIGGKQDG